MSPRPKKHTVVRKPISFLKKTTKSKGVTLAKDKNGFFVYTHRARSKSYSTIDKIPTQVIEFIESTG
jgi:hypothetical protein